MTVVAAVITGAFATNPTEQEFHAFIDQRMENREDGFSGILIKAKYRRSSRFYGAFGLHRVEHRLNEDYREYLGLFGEFYLVGISRDESEGSDD